MGGNEIAFVRDGHLWTIDPDGSNAFEAVSGSDQVIGYAWSPDHHIFVFRTLDSNFAKSAAGKHIAFNPITGMPGDEPSTLNTVGIDGGSPIPIIFASSDTSRSNAWWNASGNRLLYREEPVSTVQSPLAVSWWVSQNDQPGGIARKSLPNTFSIPSFSSNSTMAIGNSGQGVFTTTLAGTNLQYVMPSVLSGHPLPASLERVLWQPAHQNPAVLYAVAVPTSQSQPFSSKALTVQLTLRESDGHTSTLATCSCTQFAWSPDGNSILYTTGSTYTVLNIHTNAAFSISGEVGSLPYWSPDSQFLLLDGLHTLVLVQVGNKSQQVLLSDSSATAGSGASSSTLPGVDALLQPASNSPWAADGRHFLFLTRNRLTWQGQHLRSGNGLYTIAIDSQGKPQGMPTIVDSGNDSQAGWSYEDSNTSFLF
ncbi:MAG TPA: hypothetical protein VJ761_21395 [Ktedonobacteraceae bacterium]|nr:hypothetical protein [Ktedonobacteraceae bacterium]